MTLLTPKCVEVTRQRLSVLGGSPRTGPGHGGQAPRTDSLHITPPISSPPTPDPRTGKPVSEQTLSLATVVSG